MQVGTAFVEEVAVVVRGVLAVVLAAVLVAGIASGLVVAAPGEVARAQAEPGESEVEVTDDELVTRLLELEPDLPAEVVPVGVEVDDPGEDARTWGTLRGDATGPAAVLSTLAPQLQRLYADADDGHGPLADAVAEVARGWLDLGAAYDQLSRWEVHDLAFPLDASDDAGVSTGADELRGRAEAALRQVLAANERFVRGYTALRSKAELVGDERETIVARTTASEAFEADQRPAVLRLLSLPGTATLAPTERFVSEAPGVDARARALTVTCEPDDGADADGAVVDDASAHEPGARSRVGDDCPDLPPQARVSRER